MDFPLPKHSWPFVSPEAGFDWSTAEAHPQSLQGLFGDFIYWISQPARAIVLASDADIDTDGPGGSLKTDPYWQAETSLCYSNGKSCDSRQFPGVVMPPALTALGARMGDFGFCIWGGRMVACQIYDTGPAKKIGEISIFLGRMLGIVKPTQTDRQAAVNGNEVKDLVTVLFPGSGHKRAVPPELILETCSKLITPFRDAASNTHI